MSVEHVFCLSNLSFPCAHKSPGAGIRLILIIFLETSRIAGCTLWKQLWGKTRSCHDQPTLPVPVSYCLSLCFVPPQSQSASPKQRKQSVFTPPALKGTVQVLALPRQGARLAPWRCLFSSRGDAGAWAMALCPRAAQRWKVRA